VSGLLLGELTSPGDRTGLGSIKIVIIFLNVIAIGIHVAAMFTSNEYWPVLIYIRNLFCGFSFLCCCVQILDFLSFHYLFGPWAIIISSLIIDTGKFLTVLMLFEFGFTMLVLAMNQAYYPPTELQSGTSGKEGTFHIICQVKNSTHRLRDYTFNILTFLMTLRYIE
jgi:hypothetical protein